jgi:predicted nucleic acid-binding protein
MSFVVDVSVAIKWFVKEPLHDEADRLLDGRGDLHAPDFLIVELANAAWKKARRKEIGRLQAMEMVQGCLQGVPTLHRSTDLAQRALQIGLELDHPVYDCVYIACAEELGRILVTADARLARVVQATPFSARVVHLSNVGGRPN